MKDSARVVVIGGGVVGCSILFHLAKMGWKDVVLLERDELTSGSSWHAAGSFHTVSSDPNVSKLQDYTINLYKEIEETSGHSISLHKTGGFYLASNQSWYDYLKRERSKARTLGLDQEFVSLDEVVDKHPLIDPKHYVAALWDPTEAMLTLLALSMLMQNLHAFMALNFIRIHQLLRPTKGQMDLGMS